MSLYEKLPHAIVFERMRRELRYVRWRYGRWARRRLKLAVQMIRGGWTSDEGLPVLYSWLDLPESLAKSPYIDEVAAEYAAYLDKLAERHGGL